MPTYNKERLASLTAASSLTTHVEKRVEEDSGGGEREKTSWESERGRVRGKIRVGVRLHNN